MSVWWKGDKGDWQPLAGQQGVAGSRHNSDRERVWVKGKERQRERERRQAAGDEYVGMGSGVHPSPVCWDDGNDAYACTCAGTM